MYRVMLLCVLFLYSCGAPLIYYKSTGEELPKLSEQKRIAIIGSISMNPKDSYWSWGADNYLNMFSGDIIAYCNNNYSSVLMQMVEGDSVYSYNFTTIEGIDSSSYVKVNDLLFEVIGLGLYEELVTEIDEPWDAKDSYLNWYKVFYLDVNKLNYETIEEICSLLNVDGFIIGFHSNMVWDKKLTSQYSTRASLQLLAPNIEKTLEWRTLNISPQIFKGKKSSTSLYPNRTMKTNIDLSNQATAYDILGAISGSDNHNDSFLTPTIKVEKDESISILIPYKYSEDVKVVYLNESNEEIVYSLTGNSFGGVHLATAWVARGTFFKDIGYLNIEDPYYASELEGYSQFKFYYLAEKYTSPIFRVLRNDNITN